MLSGAPIAFVTFLLQRPGLEVQIVLDCMSHACHLCSVNNFWGPLPLACTPQFGLMRILPEPKPCNQPSAIAVLKIVGVTGPKGN